ncbi:hypothetical protein GXY_02131 [Novacetimonas hansenii ATCC 23769]|uniref:Uncharacterized protein n=1 Tax=Novacetimonas hansenii ATCC 23769 TaxID=714995 RepID=D5QBD3_NOVHA|nr:hypothetical protein GXY_02131 [Novacetimonas hansenii ATCC 23769]
MVHPSLRKSEFTPLIQVIRDMMTVTYMADADIVTHISAVGGRHNKNGW